MHHRLWLVWGKQRRTGEYGPRSRGIQQLYCGRKLGDAAGEYGTRPHIRGWDGGGFIPEDKLDVIALKSRYSGD